MATRRHPAPLPFDPHTSLLTFTLLDAELAASATRRRKVRPLRCEKQPRPRAVEASRGVLEEPVHRAGREHGIYNRALSAAEIAVDRDTPVGAP